MNESQRWFYVARRGAVDGPYSPTQIEQQIRSGRLRATDALSPTGQDRWVKAGLLNEFPYLTSRYHDWIWCMKNTPRGLDAKFIAAIVPAAPLTLAAAIVGFFIFPPGQYARIVLAAPGILVGLLFLYAFGFILFKLPRRFAFVLSAIMTVPAVAALVAVIQTLPGSLDRP